MIYFEKHTGIMIPIVGVEWVEISLQMKEIRFPRNYAFNHLYIEELIVSQQIPRLRA